MLLRTNSLGQIVLKSNLKNGDVKTAREDEGQKEFTESNCTLMSSFYSWESLPQMQLVELP